MLNDQAMPRVAPYFVIACLGISLRYGTPDDNFTPK